MNGKRKLIILLLVLSIVIILIGGTYAYWSWQLSANQRTTITLTYSSSFSCTADGGGNITSNDKQLAPASCTNSEHAIIRTVTVTPNLGEISKLSLNLKLKINDISEALSETEYFKYAFTKDASSCTTDVIASGDFQGTTDGDEIDLLVEKEYILSEPDV